MAGSVSRAIDELEALLEQVDDPEMRQLIQILLRLLMGGRPSPVNEQDRKSETA